MLHLRVTPIDECPRQRGERKGGRRNLPRWTALRAGWATGGALVIGTHIAVAILFQSVNPYETQVFPECVWHQMTGWECPSCGGTRALYLLMSGDLIGSLAMNPLVMASYAGAALVTAQALAERARRRRLHWPVWLSLWLIGGAALHTGLVRNLW